MNETELMAKRAKLTREISKSLRVVIWLTLVNVVCNVTLLVYRAFM